MSTKTEKVKEFFEEPSRYLGERFSILVRAQIARDFVGERERIAIADLGCGDGSISLPLLGVSNQITLVDLAENMLQVAKKNTPPAAAGRVRFLNCEFSELPDDPEFDVVLCIGVLAHVPSVDEAIAKVARICKRGGKCIFQLTDHTSLLARLSRLKARLRNRSSQRERGYSTNPTTLPQIVALANQHGLRLTGQRRYSVILPLMRYLPANWMYRYHLLSATNPLLSRCGSELMVCLEKTE